jgi:hypothetical protein
MRPAKKRAIWLTIVALVLCAVQAEVWVRATEQARTPTAMQNKEGHHQTTDIPGVAGLCLLVVADVVASMPAPETRE